MPDDFEPACQRVLKALRLKSWTVLRRECASPLALVHYSRAYDQMYPKGLFDTLFATYSFPRSDELMGRNAPDCNYMHVSSILVDTGQPLDKLSRRVLSLFLQEAHRTLHPPGGSPAVEVGRNIQSGEATFLFGPGIRGKIASSADWRVQMENINGKWRVRSLIFDSH